MTLVAVATPTMGHTIKGLAVVKDSTTGVQSVTAVSVADTTVTELLLQPITRVTTPGDAIGVGSTVAQAVGLAVTALAVPALQAVGVVPIVMTDATAQKTADKLRIRLAQNDATQKLAKDVE